MEYIKVAKVDNVILYRRGFSIKGTLHLTTHHLIFTTPPSQISKSKEIWICYPIIEKVDKKLGSALLNLEQENTETIGSTNSSERSIIGNSLSNINSGSNSNANNNINKGGSFNNPNYYKGASLRIRCKDFTYYSMDFGDDSICDDVFETLIKLICLPSIKNLYAFLYNPIPLEQKLDGWSTYNPIEEFKRQGITENSRWRISDINENYEFCPSYPKLLVVPESISNNVLKHAGKFRSKFRIPAFTYRHKNDCTITRCAQPLIGLKQSRSIQDEKLINDIFQTNNCSKNLIVDLRPVTNAMAQTALGAGTENIDNYPNCSKIFLNIDNIHVMRESLNRLVEILKDNDLYKKKTINRDLLVKTNWLKHISLILNGVDRIIKSIHLNNMNILIHCSDGWDRTSQVTSLVELCLDPYYRTFKGFQVLVEKDWCSFGYRFNERSDHLNEQLNSTTNPILKKIQKNLKSPIFHQFLDCIYQITKQYPEKFEFNERFLRRLLYHSYSCQYGTFLCNSERERYIYGLQTKTRSVWDYFNARQAEFTNPNYENPLQSINSLKESIDDNDIIYPNFKNLSWWYQLFGRTDEEMNATLSSQMSNNMRSHISSDIDSKQAPKKDSTFSSTSTSNSSSLEILKKDVTPSLTLNAKSSNFMPQESEESSKSELTIGRISNTDPLSNEIPVNLGTKIENKEKLFCISSSANTTSTSSYEFFDGKVKPDNLLTSIKKMEEMKIGD